MTRAAALGPLLFASLWAAPAAAQIMPGVVAPRTAMDAMSIGQMLACTFAASGRPSPVQSADTSSSVGLTYHPDAPEAVLAATGMRGGGILAFTVDNPEGEVWIINDPRARRCAVATAAGDLAAIETRFTSDFDGGIMGYRADRGSDAPNRRYRSREIGLAVTLRRPATAGAPYVVITERDR